jgi:microcystin-dependent protein
VAEPFLSEIRIMSFSFAPKGWALCDGQILPINQNQALFSLLGTTYGGDGRVTFALPDLRGRTAVHNGDGLAYGERGGETAHTLTITELPAHVHGANASSSPGDGVVPTNTVLAGPLNQTYRAPDAAAATMIQGTLGEVGGSQPHQNMMPFLTLSFCIALQGIFPSRN